MFKREMDDFVKERGQNEDQFNVEVPIPNAVYPWSKDYKPIKPKYFNRVHMGHEWNKYNQTHYDKENPPPKVIMGYKFNIFYPELVDMSKTPNYFVEECENNDYKVIRFHASAPYEDIAFLITSKEWEYNHKQGFRCAFERGVLKLWFHLKRYKYRR